MSILIKGMEMPKDCGHCRFAVDGWCYAYGKPNINALANDGRTNFCPLVPVPPHGRLIDADALMLKILDYIEEYSDVDEKGWHNLKWCAMKEAEMAINNAPTIIAAEELAMRGKNARLAERGGEMTAKQFLSRGRWIEWEITSLIRTRDETRDRLTHITQNYDGDGAQSTKDPHKFDALVELEYKLDERIDALCAVKTEILDTICKLEDSRERLALQLYYIDMKTWEEVCVEMTYSWKQMMRIRKKAISHVDEIMGIE